MSMNNGHIWNKHSFIIFVHPSCDVDIFRIHKETFIKQTHIFKTRNSEEHEAALMIWNVHLLFVIIEFQHIAYI